MSDEPHICPECGRPLEDWACEADCEPCACGADVLRGRLVVQLHPEEKTRIVRALNARKQGIQKAFRPHVLDFLNATCESNREPT